MLKVFERDFPPIPPLIEPKKEMPAFEPEKRKVIGDPVPPPPKDKNQNKAKPKAKPNKQGKPPRKIIWD